MSSYTIDELISGYYEKTFSEITEVPLPRFSLKHKMQMKRIFRQFAKNKKPNSINEHSAYQRAVERHNPLSLHKRLVIISVFILFLALATGFILLFVSDGFQGTIHADNTHLFAFSTDNCPDKIERVYTLSVVPEGFEMYDSGISNTSVLYKYRNSAGQKLFFKQIVKSKYGSYINTEGYSFKEIEIDGCNAVYVGYDTEAGKKSLVIWDNRDYILTLWGNINEEELINLAIINEKCGF